MYASKQKMEKRQEKRVKEELTLLVEETDFIASEMRKEMKNDVKLDNTWKGWARLMARFGGGEESGKYLEMTNIDHD